MKVIASRCWPGVDRPEGSAVAARAALAAGADGVQVDVRVTRDGVPVCLSSPLLRPAAGAVADVSTLDYLTVRRADPAVMSVEDILAAVRGRGGRPTRGPRPAG